MKKLHKGQATKLKTVRAELMKAVRAAVAKCFELDDTSNPQFVAMTCTEAELAAEYVFNKYFMH